VRSIADILASASRKSDWASWLATSSSASATETRACLDRALAQLPRTTLSRLERRLQRADQSGIDAVIHELVAFEACWTFRLSPTFEPDAGPQRPDLSIQVGNMMFWCDVFVTYRPTSTLTTFGGARGYVDAGQTAKKIADTVSAKAGKYKKLNGPLIVFVMFGDYNVGLHDLETALYGSTVDEVSTEGVSVMRCHPDWHRHGILCPPLPDAPYSWLSAVISCDWFDTLNKSARGRRLHCVVYHHWRPHVALPLGAFAPFCDLSWRLDAQTQRFVPQVKGNSSMVMSTTSHDPPRFAPYSSQVPW
jgi:hypothetical protein